MKTNMSGLGIRPELFNDVLDCQPAIDFFEAHSENYFGNSNSRHKLLQLRADYPVSLHGVGLSLGRADQLDAGHLMHLKALVDEVQPVCVSEHLSWSAYSHIFVPDLLPLPLTSEALQVMCDHVSQMQDALQRPILVENPSNYLLFDQLDIPEPEFLNELAQRTGCQILLDVNNVYVSAENLQRDASAYIKQINGQFVGQYHLAGHMAVERSGESVLVDTHNQPVCDDVWQLFDQTLTVIGARPTLLEWDSDFPELPVLLEQVNKIDQRLSNTLPHIVRTEQQMIADTLKPRQTTKQPLVSLADHQATFLAAMIYDDLTELRASETSRLWVYQNNIYGALLDYLSAVYPAVRGVVGEAYFKQLAHQLVRKSPPDRGNIHDYGNIFKQLCNDIDALSELPYLPDLIDYEWALHKAYYAAPGDLAVSGYTQDELLQLPVAFADAVCLIDSNYPVIDIHRQSQPDYNQEVSIDLAQGGQFVLVYKDKEQVCTKQLDASQYHFLQCLQGSDNLNLTIEKCSWTLSVAQITEALSTVVLSLPLLTPVSQLQRQSLQTLERENNHDKKNLSAV